MAILSQNVLEDIKTAEVSLGYEPIPEGDYTVKVDNTDIKPTKNGAGQYIKVEFVVMGPKFQGRKLFANFNIVNDSAEAMRIGRQQIKSLMIAGGMTQDQVNKFNDTDQLLGLTCNVRVGVEDGKGQYEPQNRIKSFKKMEAMSLPSVPAMGGSFSEAFSRPAAGNQSWFK